MFSSVMPGFMPGMTLRTRDASRIILSKTTCVA
jgi:hypothetical protein